MTITDDYDFNTTAFMLDCMNDKESKNLINIIEIQK